MLLPPPITSAYVFRRIPRSGTCERAREGRDERPARRVPVHAERDRLAAEPLSVGLHEGARLGGRRRDVDVRLPGGRSEEALRGAAQLPDRLRELEAEGPEKAGEPDASLGQLANGEEMVGEEGVRDEDVRAAVANPPEERREVGEPGGERLERDDLDPGGVELHALAGRELGRAGRGGVEDGHAPRANEVADDADGGRDVRAEARDPEEVAVPSRGQALVERRRGKVRHPGPLGDLADGPDEAVHVAAEERDDAVSADQLLGGGDGPLGLPLVVTLEEPDRAPPHAARGVRVVDRDPHALGNGQPLGREETGARVDLAEQDGVGGGGRPRARRQEDERDHDGGGEPLGSPLWTGQATGRTRSAASRSPARSSRRRSAAARGPSTAGPARACGAARSAARVRPSGSARP